MTETEIVDLTQIVGEIEIPCEYDPQLNCGPSAAKWHMLVRCGCGNIASRLSCDGCKNKWLASEDAAECPACGEIFVPARKAFALVEAL